MLILHGALDTEVRPAQADRLEELARAQERSGRRNEEGHHLRRQSPARAGHDRA